MPNVKNWSTKILKITQESEKNNIRSIFISSKRTKLTSSIKTEKNIKTQKNQGNVQKKVKIADNTYKK